MAITKPTPIIKPFANTGLKDNVDVAASLTKANQETGFPLRQALLQTQQGLPPQRKEFNGIFNLYSSFILWLTSGGAPTFEQTISNEHGGYPTGVILFSASDSTFQISLKDNNTANFITMPAYLNDGVNWKRLSTSALDFPDIQDDPVTGDIVLNNRVVNSTFQTYGPDAGGSGAGRTYGLTRNPRSQQINGYISNIGGSNYNSGWQIEPGKRLYQLHDDSTILDFATAGTYAFLSEVDTVSNALTNNGVGITTNAGVGSQQWNVKFKGGLYLMSITLPLSAAVASNSSHSEVLTYPGGIIVAASKVNIQITLDNPLSSAQCNYVTYTTAKTNNNFFAVVENNSNAAISSATWNIFIIVSP